MLRTQIVVLLLLVRVQLFAQHDECVYPGISMEDFKKVYPQFVPQIENDPLWAPDTIAGGAGYWKISLSRDTVDEAYFDGTAKWQHHKKAMTSFIQKAEQMTQQFGPPVNMVLDTGAFYYRIWPWQKTREPIISYTWLTRHSKISLGIYANQNADNPTIEKRQRHSKPKTRHQDYLLLLQIGTSFNPNLKTDWNFYPSMSLEELKERNSDFLDGGHNIRYTWERKDTINGKEGEWTYKFGLKNQLKSFSFRYINKSDEGDALISVIDESERLKTFYTKLCGEPFYHNKNTYEVWTAPPYNTCRVITVGLWRKDKYFIDVGLFGWANGCGHNISVSIEYR